DSTALTRDVAASALKIDIATTVESEVGAAVHSDAGAATHREAAAADSDAGRLGGGSGAACAAGGGDNPAIGAGADVTAGAADTVKLDQALRLGRGAQQEKAHPQGRCRSERELQHSPAPRGGAERRPVHLVLVFDLVMENANAHADAMKASTGSSCVAPSKEF